MNYFLIALTLLMVSVSSFAMQLTCITAYPTTSVVSEIEGDEFVVHVYHHNGVRYMPLQTGIVTPNDLPNLAAKAELFELMGNHYALRWDLSDCKRVNEDIMSCTRGKETEINGVKLRPWGIFTKTISSHFDVYSYEQIEVFFMMYVEDKPAHFSMQYLKEECTQTEGKRAKLLKTILSK